MTITNTTLTIEDGRLLTKTDNSTDIGIWGKSEIFSIERKHVQKLELFHDTKGVKAILELYDRPEITADGKNNGAEFRDKVILRNLFREQVEMLTTWFNGAERPLPEGTIKEEQK